MPPTALQGLLAPMQPRAGLSSGSRLATNTSFGKRKRSLLSACKPPWDPVRGLLAVRRARGGSVTRGVISLTLHVQATLQNQIPQILEYIKNHLTDLEVGFTVTKQNVRQSSIQSGI